MPLASWNVHEMHGPGMYGELLGHGSTLSLAIRRAKAEVERQEEDADPSESWLMSHPG